MRRFFRGVACLLLAGFVLYRGFAHGDEALQAVGVLALFVAATIFELDLADPSRRGDQ